MGWWSEEAVGPLLLPGVKNAAMVLLAVGVGMKLRSRL